MSTDPTLTLSPGIPPGTRFGTFEILSPLGRGGMGEVYRARDIRLGREVALKMLPTRSLSDADSRARMEAEARLVASLNHANIASLYGVVDSATAPCLVLELVPGRTLAERLAFGPLPLREALGIARQIAEALEAAHLGGVVHCDLKPSNVKVTPEGRVKVLDFGLADAPGFVAAGDVSGLGALTHGGAQPLCGTPAYMSPERIGGRAVTAQMDVWSFGCVLYEMLTGRKAFQGATLSETIVAILDKTPDWRRLPPETPMRVRELIERCLRKDPHRRLRHIGDALIEIEAALQRRPPVVASPATPRWYLRGSSIAVAASLLALTIGFGLAPTASPPRAARLHLNVPAAAPLALDRQPSIALSPDGTELVYVGTDAGGSRLYARDLDELEVRPLAGTDGATSPVFSPDGSSLVFARGGKIERLPAAGGEPVALCDAPALHGMAWGDDGQLYYSPTSDGGIHAVPVAGGSPRAITVPDIEAGESAHRWPEALPGGRALLFTIHRAGSDSLDEARIAALSLSTGQRKILIEGGAFPRYLPTGHLVYARSGTLFAVPFDVARLEVRGPPVPVVNAVSFSPLSGAAHFTFSRTGVLVYSPGGTQPVARSLLWVSRDGATRPVTGTRRAYCGPRLSPQGGRLILAIEDDRGFDLWSQELDREALMRLTAEPGNERLPLWMPEGLRFVYSASATEQASSLLWKAADGGGEALTLLDTGHEIVPGSVSRDGAWLAYTERDPGRGSTGSDIWVLPLSAGDRHPEPFLQTPFDEAGPSFSPAGNWLAFTSDESGRSEVYVRPFPGPGGKWQVSTEGGSEPVWSPKGDEIFFRSATNMMAAPVTTQDGFQADKPVILFEDTYDRGLLGYPNYDVTPDGSRFLMIRSEPRPAPTQLNVVLDWFADLTR